MMFNRLVLTGLATTAAAASTGHAAPTASTPPRTVFNGSKLEPYVNAWQYVLTMPDGTVRPQGIWTDQLLRKTVDDKNVFIRVQGTIRPNGASTTIVNTFDPATMSPISDQETMDKQGLQKRSFRTAEVETHQTGTAGASDRVTVTELPDPIYDYYGGMYALLLSTAPLRIGYRGSFNSIDEFEDKPVKVDFQVLGREKVMAGSRGPVETWKIAASRPGEYDLIAWVSEKAPYVIRLNLVLPDKRLYDWTMF